MTASLLSPTLWGALQHFCRRGLTMQGRATLVEYPKASRGTMKEHPVCIGGLLALILLQASAASAQQVVRRVPPPPARIELRVPKTVVPMELFGGRPVVSVRVNGKGPFRFALDTGVTGTVVSKELAHELGLP